MTRLIRVRVDREVFEAIQALRAGTSDTPGEALRRFLGLNNRDDQRLADNIECLKRLETQLRTQRRRKTRAPRRKQP